METFGSMDISINPACVYLLCNTGHLLQIVTAAGACREMGSKFALLAAVQGAKGEPGDTLAVL
jgi:hypothetical protein